MVTAKEHYDQLLGPIYEWMLGDPAEMVERDWPELERVRRHRGDWASIWAAGEDSTPRCSSQ